MNNDQEADVTNKNSTTSNEGNDVGEPVITPKVIESDYGLEDASPAVVGKDEDGNDVVVDLDPCCTRCKVECICGGCGGGNWFGLVDKGNRIIDIPASFGPTSPQARVMKFVLMIWFNASTIYKWYTKRDTAAFFLSWLTNWSLLFSCIYLIMSFINSTVLPPEQPGPSIDDKNNGTIAVTSVWIKSTWLLFEVSAHFVMMTIVLYWALQYEPPNPDDPSVVPSNMDYINVFTHACTIFVWIEGLYINRIPVRWIHMLVPQGLSALYVGWLAIHQMCTNVGNPQQFDDNPETNDDLMYPAVNFTETPAYSSILVCLVVLVMVPLIHWLLWILSLWSVCNSRTTTTPAGTGSSMLCNCNGYNRRFINGDEVSV